MILSIFHMLVGYLYIFSVEMTIQILYPLSNWVIWLCIIQLFISIYYSVVESFICTGYQSLVRYMICKYFFFSHSMGCLFTFFKVSFTAKGKKRFQFWFSLCILEATYSSYGCAAPAYLLSGLKSCIFCVGPRTRGGSATGPGCCASCFATWAIWSSRYNGA